MGEDVEYNTHTHTHTHTGATYPDESVGSVAPLEAPMRVIVAIYRIRSQQEACKCVLCSLVCLVFV